MLIAIFEHLNDSLKNRMEILIFHFLHKKKHCETSDSSNDIFDINIFADGLLISHHRIKAFLKRKKN